MDMYVVSSGYTDQVSNSSWPNPSCLWDLNTSEDWIYGRNFERHPFPEFAVSAIAAIGWDEQLQTWKSSCHIMATVICQTKSFS